MATMPIASVRGEASPAMARAVSDALRQVRGTFVEVVIQKPPTTRSLRQNAYLHAKPFPIIAEELGDSVEGVKYDLMGEKWGWKPSPIDPGRMVPVKPSTASMTVEECSEFIEWLIPFAAKQGISVPLPHEDER